MATHKQRNQEQNLKRKERDRKASFIFLVTSARKTDCPQCNSILVVSAMCLSGCALKPREIYFGLGLHFISESKVYTTNFLNFHFFFFWKKTKLTLLTVGVPTQIFILNFCLYPFLFLKKRRTVVGSFRNYPLPIRWPLDCFQDSVIYGVFLHAPYLFVLHMFC